MRSWLRRSAFGCTFPHTPKPPSSGDLITSLNLFIADGKFIRGTIDTDAISYRHLANQLQQPLLVICFPLDERGMKYPYHIEHLTTTMEWLLSKEASEWLEVATSIPESSAYEINLIGNVTGAHFFYAWILRRITDKTIDRWNVGRFVALHPPFNPNCDDDSFHEAAEKYYQNSRSFWSNLWKEYLPDRVDYRNCELFPNLLDESLVSQFPPTLMVYSELDPNRNSNELFCNKLTLEKKHSTLFISGSTNIVFDPTFQKGKLIVEKIVEFIKGRTAK
jgi:hypothetical protein